MSVEQKVVATLKCIIYEQKPLKCENFKNIYGFVLTFIVLLLFNDLTATLCYGNPVFTQGANRS